MPKSKTSLKELLYDVRRIAEHREVLTEKKIRKIYKSLVSDLTAYVGENYVKYADTDGRMYVSYLDQQNKRAKFLEEIAANINSISPKIEKEILDLAAETYDETYKGMLKAFDKAEDTAEFAAMTKDIQVRPEVLKQAVTNEITKLTLPPVLEKNRKEVIYQVQQTLNIGLMNGDRYETIAKNLTQQVDINYNKAMRIARTESHRNIEGGFMDCAVDISDSVYGRGLIYAATWRTMKDERVRPQRRRKSKKGVWKTTFSRSGANHMKMEGQTVQVGKLFDLGNGVKARAPSHSGVAAHDCNCRCFVEYNLMTPAEFEEATGKKGKAIDEAEQFYSQSIKKEPQITSDLKEVVADTGGTLVGLEYRMKTGGSYRRKVDKEIVDLNKAAAKQGITYTATQHDAVSNMRDVVRYTSISDKSKLVNDYRDITGSLENKGYKVVRVKNTFAPNEPYKGINAIVQDASGYNFELQFHTKQSFELKNGILHELYEKEREVTTLPAEKVALQKQMKKISDSIVLPDDVDKIKSFSDLP